MTEIKQKNSENNSQIDIFDVLSTIVITVCVLAVPAICMGIFAYFYCITECSPSSIDPALNQLGYNLGGAIPIIGLFSTIIISCFVGYILKMRETFWGTLLTIVITSGVLIAVFMVSMYLQEWR
jgi:hypothetical protein